ncbi:MAG: response regulator [SAR324 cluster bacterium]|nr:response regulator [SAR324 cluster bacterium]
MERILIVDDSKVARMLIRRCLEIAGYADKEFMEAGNGKEALAELKKKTADLVIADLNMPLMDGEGLIKWMRKSSVLQDIPVIFVTSANNEARSAQLTKLGAKAILGKPIAPPRLAEVLESLNI